MEMKENPKLLSPLVLAFLGDAVFELLVREKLVEGGNLPVNRLHQKAVHYVCAGAQWEGYLAVRDMLTEEEEDIFRRGRNTKSGVPKNADPAAYRAATGLEALFGYLYACGRHDRYRQLFSVIWEQKNQNSEERYEKE